MTKISELIDEELVAPVLPKPKNLQELLEQMAIISEAIGRCEKILQHLAISGFNDDMEEYVSQHIRLIGMKNQLYKKYKRMESKNNSKFIRKKSPKKNLKLTSKIRKFLNLDYK